MYGTRFELVKLSLNNSESVCQYAGKHCDSSTTPSLSRTPPDEPGSGSLVPGRLVIDFPCLLLLSIPIVK